MRNRRENGNNNNKILKNDQWNLYFDRSCCCCCRRHWFVLWSVNCRFVFFPLLMNGMMNEQKKKKKFSPICLTTKDQNLFKQKKPIYNKKTNQSIGHKKKVIPGMHSTIEISITIKSLTTNELIIDNHNMSVQKKKTKQPVFFPTRNFFPLCSTTHTHTQYKSNVNYP